MEDIKNIDLQKYSENTISENDIQSEIQKIQQLMDKVEAFDEQINP